MNSGIYALYWWEQDLVYIGLSQNLDNRRKEHFTLMRNNKHTNYKVQNTFNQYGEPEFIVLERCSISELPEKEIQWCNEFEALSTQGLCLVEPGVVGFGINSNASKYTKRQVLSVFSLLYRTSFNDAVISRRLNVSINLVADIRTGRSHLWLKERYPNKYTAMQFMLRDTLHNAEWLFRKHSTIVVSPTGVLHEVLNIRHFAKLNNLYNTHLGEVIRGTRKSHKGWKLHKPT